MIFKKNKTYYMTAKKMAHTIKYGPEVINLVTSFLKKILPNSIVTGLYNKYSFLFINRSILIQEGPPIGGGQQSFNVQSTFGHLKGIKKN